MKKHDEGYALVLVLVVVTVLCLVAMAMMAASLKNLTNQQSSIERMQAKYQAQGEIEKVIAEIEKKITDTIDGEQLSGFGSSFFEAVGTVSTAECTKFEADSDKITFVLEAQSGTLRVVCEIKIEGTVTSVENAHSISAPNLDLIYTSYTIVQGGESNDG